MAYHICLQLINSFNKKKKKVIKWKKSYNHNEKETIYTGLHAYKVRSHIRALFRQAPDGCWLKRLDSSLRIFSPLFQQLENLSSQK